MDYQTNPYGLFFTAYCLYEKINTLVDIKIIFKNIKIKYFDIY